jgi:hypothetical protein
MVAGVRQFSTVASSTDRIFRPTQKDRDRGQVDRAAEWRSSAAGRMTVAPGHDGDAGGTQVLTAYANPSEGRRVIFKVPPDAADSH